MWLIESKMPRGKNYELTSISSESIIRDYIISKRHDAMCLQKEKDNLINVLIEGSFLSCIKLTMSIGYVFYGFINLIVSRHILWHHCDLYFRKGITFIAPLTQRRSVLIAVCDYVVIECLYIINKLKEATN